LGFAPRSLDWAERGREHPADEATGGGMPKRWSIQLTLQTLDDAGNVTGEEPFHDGVSKTYPDAKEEQVRGKADKIKNESNRQK
jgi:hypothetical protein